MVSHACEAFAGRGQTCQSPLSGHRKYPQVNNLCLFGHFAARIGAALMQHVFHLECCPMATGGNSKHEESVLAEPCNAGQRFRALEFFAGIGGFACAASKAWPTENDDILAIDIDRDARLMYEQIIAIAS